MFQTNVVEEIKTHISFSIFSLFFRNLSVYEIIWQNSVEWGQATDYNMAHAHCMLDN